MNEKIQWLMMIDKKAGREKNLSILVKIGLLFVFYLLMQLFSVNVPFCVFALCVTIAAYLLDVVVNQNARKYQMLYEQARKTLPSEITLSVTPAYDQTGLKAGKADFLSVCADWRIYAYYAFFFVLNLALLIVVAVSH